MPRYKLFGFCFLIFFLLLPLPTFAVSPIQERADRFLALANAGYQALYRVNSEAQWLAVTDVTPAHDAAAEAAGKAYAGFNGNPAIISEARDLLTHEKELNELTVRQLKQLLLNAAYALPVASAAASCSGVTSVTAVHCVSLFTR